MLRIQIPASTANIGPGYDTFGLALNLYNYVNVLPGRNPHKLTFTISGEKTRALADARHNLVVQAVTKVMEEAGQKAGGWHLQLENNIPVSRGLGSSSAAIVGGLVAGNAICGEPFSKQELLKFAVEMEGHPDNVAPTLLGGFVASAQYEDFSTDHFAFLPPADLRFVVAIPDFYLSTRQVRAAIPKKIVLKDAIFNLQRAVVLSGALAKGDLELFGRMVEDKMHQQYRLPFINGGTEVLAAAKEAGALASAVSGAGPTLIAFCREEKAAEVAASMETIWQQNGVNVQTMVLEADTEGAKLVSE